MEPVLSVQNLSLSFAQDPDHLVVNQVSFDIRNGETLALVGESGSGKTLTAMSVMGLLPQDAIIMGGDIWLLKKDGQKIRLRALEKAQLQKVRGNDISMVFQEPGTSLNPAMKCGEQIAEVIMTHEKCNYYTARTKTIQLLREVQMADPWRIFRAYPHQLSGGQKQRVMIAMAISCHPAVILADEPTSALDASVQKGIVELLKGLQEKYRIGILFISHDLELVRGFADRVLVMYQGCIVEDKPVESLFSNPEHPYTKGLLLCKPRPGVRLKQLPTVADFIQAEKEGLEHAFLNDSNLISSAEHKANLERILSSAPHIAVRNLSVSFGGSGLTFFRKNRKVRAVDSISFDVFKGETLGIVGESGSGKTSLGRALLRLIETDSGEIRIGNFEIAKLNKKKLREVRTSFQLVFQDPYASLNPLKTIGNAMMEPLEVHHIGKSQTERKEKAIRFLEMVGLQEEHFYRLPHAFSGGQRQRICIARALILEPEFLVLDEPVSSLDVSVQAQVINLLVRLKEKLGFTCIFISHDLNLVRFVSDRIMVMKDGKMVEIAETETLFKNPATAYTRNLIDSLPGYGFNRNDHAY